MSSQQYDNPPINNEGFIHLNLKKRKKKNIQDENKRQNEINKANKLIEDLKYQTQKVEDISKKMNFNQKQSQKEEDENTIKINEFNENNTINGNLDPYQYYNVIHQNNDINPNNKNENQNNTLNFENSNFKKNNDKNLNFTLFNNNELENKENNNIKLPFKNKKDDKNKIRDSALEENIFAQKDNIENSQLEENYIKNSQLEENNLKNKKDIKNSQLEEINLKNKKDIKNSQLEENNLKNKKDIKNSQLEENNLENKKDNSQLEENNLENKKDNSQLEKNTFENKKDNSQLEKNNLENKKDNSQLEKNNLENKKDNSQFEENNSKNKNHNNIINSKNDDNDLSLNDIDKKNQEINENKEFEDQKENELYLNSSYSSTPNGYYINKKLTEEKIQEIEKEKEKYNSFIEKYKNKKDIIEEVDETVKEIYLFEDEEPDLFQKESFYCINSLEEEEKKLSDLFEDIKINDKNKKENRTYDFHKYKKEKTKLTQYISQLDISHPDKMIIIQQNTNLNILPQINNNLLKSYFNEDKIFNKFNSPIGRLGNTKTFIYKFIAHKNYQLMINAYRLFNYWRPSLSDGNSFYRVFMYSLIENYITNQNINELKKLICDIIQEEYITLYRNKGIDVDIALQIIKKILILVENNKIKEAYKIFNKAYRLKNHCFDYTMIIYLRNIVYQYAKEINNIYKQNKNQTEIKQEEIDDLFYIDTIIELGVEPEFFVLAFIPYLFEINLNVFWIKGDFQNPEDGYIDFIDNENKDKFPYIIMGYFFSNFFPLYSDKNNENLKIIVNENNSLLKKLTYCDENKKKCPICNDETEQVIFLQKKFIICKPCLISHVDKIFMNRTLNIKNENYYGLEYYNGPIHLQDDYYIDNYEIIELKKENIANLLFKNQTMICFRCEQNIEKNEYSMNCGCLYCENCFKTKLKKSTNEYIYLNEFEKLYNNFKKEICSCGKDFDINYASKMYKPSNEEINNAKERMKIYYKTLCYQCLQKLIEYDSNKKSEKKLDRYYSVQFKKENNEEEFYIEPHIICNKCKINQKKELNNEKEGNKENIEIVSPEQNNLDTIIKIFCKICNKFHNQIIFKERDGCCNNGCLIF